MIESVTRSRPGPDDLMRLNQELAGIVKAGIPLDRGLLLAARGFTNPEVRRVLERVQSQVQKGASLSEALSEHRGFFPESYVNLIAVGERTGSLTQALEHLIVHYRRQSRLRAAVASAVVYPATVLGIAAVVVALLLVFIVPQFAEVYHELGSELPWLTCQMIEASAFLRSNWGIVAVLSIAAFGYFLYKTVVQDVTHKDWGVMRFLPVLSTLYTYQTCLAFLSSMGILIEQGVPLAEALGLARTATVSGSARVDIDDARRRLERGEEAVEILGGLRFLPPVARTIVRYGAEQTRLGEALDEASDYYYTRLEFAQKNLVQVVEPILIVLLGGIVGTLVVALYTPLFYLPKVIGGL
ncbi:type II secretion system F family protein [Candidatus Sumerlaeota bacterium]|nr:type II secretion system F family protein [Candidatus Sumerlaeota bacterium]